MLQKLINKKQSSKGFTIIEVLIVLAIAGLIIAVVLIAIPQLQRNQRNEARKSVVNRIKTEYDAYAGNNNGNYPHNVGTGPAFDIAAFTTRYLTGLNLENPSTGTNYALANPVAVPGALPANNPSSNALAIYTSAECTGETPVTKTGARNYAFWVSLEGGAFYCVDNS